ncbi:S-formylglutathione hydrolase [uncultured Paraglaciecola sp.]|uniref:S-formylglutathione hydrolase n=1 Tax=uncultured Paraglaciecola sp. TaxID=1765024 RepID=UPI00259830FA|nr:S-formylglutathione hydrolase [uncultured Paraglaciecola sp.]
MTLESLNVNKVFDGWHKQFSYQSQALNCHMRFAIFLPPQASSTHKVPVLYWLSGLTCTDENFMQKAGAQKLAAELGMAIVAPDTSPRGSKIADDKQGSYDLGLGAGFYLNATQAPWDDHYKMYDYILTELPALIEETFPVSDKRALSGHSMGGHGALTIALKNTEKYQSVSAFSPICNPMKCPWGQKAFSAYLGDDQCLWEEYDASELIKKSTTHLPTLVSQGSSDEFLENQLKTHTIKEAASISDYPITINMEEGYDHSYYFIASFIDQHLRFHFEHLSK